MINADKMVLHSSIMVQFPEMIFGLMEFICKKAVNALLQIICQQLLSFCRICEPPQVVSMKESILLSESGSVRQNTLDINEESYSERNLDESEKKSIDTTPNSLSKIKEQRIGNAGKVMISNLNTSQ